MYSLHGILPKRDLECLRKFVIACSYLCNRVITKTDLQIADNYLMKFCPEFENIYGKDIVTPNMHLHGHLVDCMNDFGPVYSFWLFSFERYNGLLGSIPSNKKSIEMQIMSRFCRDNETIGSNYLEECYTDFYSFIAKLGEVNIDRGALHDILGSDYVSILKLSSRNFNHQSYEWLTPHYAKMTGSIETYALSNTELRCLSAFYSKTYPNINVSETFVPISCWRSKTISILDSVIGSISSRSHRSSYITAFWCADGGLIACYNNMYIQPRPGRVLFFIKYV